MHSIVECDAYLPHPRPSPSTSSRTSSEASRDVRSTSWSNCSASPATRAAAEEEDVRSQLRRVVRLRVRLLQAQLAQPCITRHSGGGSGGAVVGVAGGHGHGGALLVRADRRLRGKLVQQITLDLSGNFPTSLPSRQVASRG